MANVYAGDAPRSGSPRRGGRLGRIRPTYIRRVAVELMRLHADAFTQDFEYNKRRVNELCNVTSRKMRNRIAGYVTRLKELASRA